MTPFATDRKPFVLVVDSDPQRARSLVQHLRTGSFYAESSACGEDALKYAAENEPDAVVSDWRLSDMAGIEFTRRLKARSFPAKVVLLNDRADWRLLREAFEGGADDLLSRPVSTEELFRSLERSLGVQRGASPAPR